MLVIGIHRPVHFLFLLAAASPARAETPAGTLWTELAAKRARLPSFHQEFNVSEVSKTLHGHNRPRKWRLFVDSAQRKWSEKSVVGLGYQTRIFDGETLFTLDEDMHEYTRVKHKANVSEPAPAPYILGAAEWQKAADVKRRPCGLTGKDRECAALEVPLKPWVRAGPGYYSPKMLEGVARMALDTETGLLITAQSFTVMEEDGVRSEITTTYSLKSMRFGLPADASLFQLPPGNLREVNQLPRWYTRKSMTGKPAPEFAVKDLAGTRIALSELRGKTVLLDFWTTLCSLCRYDDPALEKLYRTYGRNDLMIVGVSVNEERATVEQFLAKHPHSYPTVLTSENEIVPPYRVFSIPTYVVIDRNGIVTTVVHDDQGFSELRKLLKKAGL